MAAGQARAAPRLGAWLRAAGPAGVAATVGGGAILALGSRGVIVAALIGSLPLVVLLAGLQLETADLRVGLRTPLLSPWAAWRGGPLLVIHSHRGRGAPGQERELRVGGRWFCPGCYGVSTGTLVGGVVAIYYLLNGFPVGSREWLSALLPFAFGPIVLRYAVRGVMRPGWRFIANAFLALGCWLLLLLVDARFGSVDLSVIAFAAVVAIAFLRQRLSSSARPTFPMGRPVVRP